MNQQLRNIYLHNHHTYLLKENLRFELAYGNEMDYIPRVERAKKRAHTLFHEVFKESETIQVIFMIGKNEHIKITKLLHQSTFKLIDSFTSSAWNDEEDTFPMEVLVIEVDKNNLRINKLIDGLCYQDFFNYGKLRINASLVFYEKKDNILLNIYDDRGCDIWSDNLLRQKQLYNDYYTWLLDYDLERMSNFYQSINEEDVTKIRH